MNIASYIDCPGYGDELLEVLIVAITSGGNMSDSSEEEDKEYTLQKMPAIFYCKDMETETPDVLFNIAVII